MHPQAWTTASVQFHQSSTARRIHEHIPLKDSLLKEAHARGLGFKSHAALIDHFKKTVELPARAFDQKEFVTRVAELAGEDTALAIDALLDGVQLNIAVIKHSPQRQRSHVYSDIAYDVNVTVALPDDSPESLKGEVLFHLPEFGRDAGKEPYRVDSAFDRRATTDYRKTRAVDGNSTVVAKLVDGHWHGSFFVYAQEHQEDDTQSIRSVKAALARAILPQLPTRVRCRIFRPDSYELGAWRVEMRLPGEVQRFWNGSPFLLDLPALSKRNFIASSEFSHGPSIARFVDGVWKADLYTNGIAEELNPTSLADVKQALLQGVDDLLHRAELHGERMFTTITDAAGNMVGTVEFRNGRYEAWRRARLAIRPGNSHKLVGRFASQDEAASAVRSGNQPSR